MVLIEKSETRHSIVTAKLIKWGNKKIINNFKLNKKKEVA